MKTALAGADGPGDGTCGVCGKVVNLDRYVCAPCITDGRAALDLYAGTLRLGRGETAGQTSLLRELQTTATRQARMNRPDDTSRPTERPLPFNERAAAILADDTAWLDTAAAALDITPRRPDQRGAPLAALIAQHLPKHAGRPAAVMIVAEARRRAARAQAVIDRPAITWFAGKCECGTDLYAREGAAAVECRACGRVHDVEARRAYLLTLVEDRLATVAELCRAVHLFEQPVTRSQITNWSSRGQLAKRGVNRNGHTVYRIGDVLNLLATSARTGKRGARPCN